MRQSTEITDWCVNSYISMFSARQGAEYSILYGNGLHNLQDITKDVFQPLEDHIEAEFQQGLTKEKY